VPNSTQNDEAIIAVYHGGQITIIAS